MKTKAVKVSVAVWLVVVAGWYWWQQRDAKPQEAIVVADGAVTVRNQTNLDWQGVRIWVNDYFMGSANVISAGGFVREPLSRFVASQGQHIDVASRITSVVVLASEPDGTRVRVTWGSPALH